MTAISSWAGDELRLTVWGAAEFAYELTVDAEGRIFVPNVGQILASGRRMSALREDLKRFLSSSYAGLTTDPPTVFMDLTVARLRPSYLRGARRWRFRVRFAAPPCLK